MGQIGKRMGVLAEFGLTPGHFKALQMLEPGEPRTMGACAEALACDASTATWLIDRLEERGLVERQASSVDRRVKSVVLTPQGIKVKQQIGKKFYEPPEALLELDDKTLARLDGYFGALERSARAVERAEKGAARATRGAGRKRANAGSVR
jgi:DNA-binding MarR family transcriptional regulator